jgi:sporulation protein YlmC with PRC-barrel domain
LKPFPWLRSQAEQQRRQIVHMHPSFGDAHAKQNQGDRGRSDVRAATLPAFAQSNPAPIPAQRVETTTAPRTVSGQWRASKLIGVNVYNTANEKIGDISEVLLDTTGKAAGIVIGVGGFLGIGQHDVLVHLDQLKFVNEPIRTTTTTATTTTTGTATTTRATRDASEKWYPDHAVMSATKDQLKAMPAFKYN